ncbi:hypothetical protein CAEBREN_03500 [Caenorhabditis brenneri]|uniref:Uncharacterized protein n=1 Tax=Caenorhabditis brenneri TaxID=135651 RepID=G0PKN0_CAEBE|nr:hypothetical protein CAEBREN_03500 [Caenorhabditis brenneri]
MRQLVAFLCFSVFLAENVNGAGNDTLEMELESNITVVKLEHGLKFQAHSEFGLPDNMTDLFNSTAADSEGPNNSSLPDSLDHHRARRSNKDDSNSEEATGNSHSKSHGRHGKHHKKGDDSEEDYKKGADNDKKTEGDDKKATEKDDKKEEDNEKANDKKESNNEKTDDKKDDNKGNHTVTATTTGNSTQSSGPGIWETTRFLERMVTVY